MKKRCPFCGVMIDAAAIECEHCGKVLRRNEADAAPRAVGLQKWEKGVPSWMIYGAVLFGVLFVVLMYYQASQRISEKNKEPADRPTQQQPVEPGTE
ncbi:MAG: hypothetical protein MK108_10535 [Mariniblastus sp.]|nr:hypothetical protein [Mariniblastus sp.]